MRSRVRPIAYEKNYSQFADCRPLHLDHLPAGRTDPEQTPNAREDAPSRLGACTVRGVSRNEEASGNCYTSMMIGMTIGSRSSL